MGFSLGEKSLRFSLEKHIIDQIVEEAVELLGKRGVRIESDKARNILADNGADVQGSHVYIPAHLIEHCISTVPSECVLYNRGGERPLYLKDGEKVFVPGSSVLQILDADSGEFRSPTTGDCRKFTSLVDSLENFALQSTSMVCQDVPSNMSDWYRLFLALLYSEKPIITGTFQEGTLEIMRNMMLCFRRDDADLRKRPLAVIDCCPSAPLQWDKNPIEDVIYGAAYHLPICIVSMPIAGVASPVTLLGTLVQHTAENLSGICVHQCVSPGAPLLYGCSASIMDMKKGTTPMGAAETMLLGASSATIGNSLGFPTHAFIGISDSKQIDYQAGFETAMGMLLAIESPLNVISGAGMLDFENCQSPEKLVADHEIISLLFRYHRGITRHSRPYAPELHDPDFQGNFLGAEKTFSLFQKEFHFPSPVINRATYQEWETRGKQSLVERATLVVREKLNNVQSEDWNSAQKELIHLVKDLFASNQNTPIPDDAFTR